MAEFTGERLIPGQVDADLLNEHMARYTFAARLARGKRVLDVGCGAGYGSAELARIADDVAAIDVAPEAVEFAGEHYCEPNLRFTQASCTALPFADASFDLVVAFEVIEHIEEWQVMLSEVRRVLRPTGQFIVSTPNKLYYTESRGADGANPFHVHEFEFQEFVDELRAFFPHLSMFLENHVEGVSFQPFEAGTTAEVRVDSAEPVPDESHFFLAVCAHRPQLGNPTFVYLPRTGNVLREREHHIAKLDSEVKQKTEWLDKAQSDLAEFDREHQKLLEMFRVQNAELEKSNAWAEATNNELNELRVEHLAMQARMEDEIAGEQERARAMAEGYQAKVAELEADIRAKTKWAIDTEVRFTAELEAANQQLVKAVEVLHQTEKELEERTAWALSMQEEARRLTEELASVRASRWFRLGSRLGVGPGSHS